MKRITLFFLGILRKIFPFFFKTTKKQSIELYPKTAKTHEDTIKIKRNVEDTNLSTNTVKWFIKYKQ
tara:strand:- start:229 stop:429 length:201 start_codon:yes stop_codon:yes gene_type:complete